MARRKPISLIHLLALIFVTGINASEDLSPHSHIVQTQNGPIQGILKQARGGSNYVAYLGLRYVKPVKRFQPSEPLEEQWTEPRVADTLENVCPQMLEIGVFAEDEDCLFLQVYVPEKHLGQETSKLPVMVFIHGGGFIFGDGNNYGADYFMESEDVILVTFNYRLGLLGFLSTGDDAITSNLGLLDQIMALRFVKENIPAFNGDASKVTVFGNSAGSASIHFMLMSPLAEGLFNAAIMQSGALSFWSYSPNPRETTLRFVKEAARNCKNIKEDAEPEEQSIQIRKCLEKKKTKQLLLSQIVFWMRWPGFNILSRFLPTAEVASHSGATHDSYFASLPESWKQTGKQTVYHNKVPVMLGTTSDEGATLFAAPVYHSEEALKQLNDEWKQVAPIAFCYEGFFPDKKLPAISKKIKKFYFGTDPITLENKQALVNLYSDVLFLLPSLFAADEMARNGFTVYPYKFSYSGEWSLRQALFKDKEDMFQGKVGHADELQYLFPHPLLGPPLEPNSESEKFSKSLVKLWTSFAKQGKPEVNWNNGNTVEWKPIQTKNQAPLSFDLMNIDKEPSIVKLDINERAQFWGKLIKDYSKEKSKATNVPKTEL